MPTTEPSINNVIASVLRESRRAWDPPQIVRSENTGVFLLASRQPDILIMEPGTSPVVVETEVVPATTVERDARERLRQIVRENDKPVLSSVAVRLPPFLRDHEGASLAHILRAPDTAFEFACFTGRTPTDAER